MAAPTLICRVAGTLVPPSPSVSTKRAVRVAVDGVFDTLAYVMLPIRTWAAIGVAFALKVITNGVVPEPPVAVPISVPA